MDLCDKQTHSEDDPLPLPHLIWTYPRDNLQQSSHSGVITEKLLITILTSLNTKDQLPAVVNLVFPYNFHLQILFYIINMYPIHAGQQQQRQ